MQMRKVLFALLMSVAAVAAVPAANAAVSVNLGINLGGYPRLVPVPGYPVYYAPGVNANYFFYDGLYWDFDGDNWYASSWYNGPWHLVDPFAVPAYLLQVPVRYYRHPPAYFRGWRGEVAPRWNEHWGRDWTDRRGGWDNRRVERVAPAPLPSYQRQYSGNRYPAAEQQSALHGQNYRYQPREQVVQQHYQQQGIVTRSPEPRADNRGRGNDQRGHDNRGHDQH
jgi:hypothetical protein